MMTGWVGVSVGEIWERINPEIVGRVANIGEEADTQVPFRNSGPDASAAQVDAAFDLGTDTGTLAGRRDGWVHRPRLASLGGILGAWTAAGAPSRATASPIGRQGQRSSASWWGSWTIQSTRGRVTAVRCLGSPARRPAPGATIVLALGQKLLGADRLRIDELSVTGRLRAPIDPCRTEPY